MKLLVGLGNPGPQYRDTRHNAGFAVIDLLATRWQVEGWRVSHRALIARVVTGGVSVILAKPLTFMNLSGEAVGGLAGYYRIEPADILVVVDEVALPIGRLRARRAGSAGGHNGLKSVMQHLGTDAFPRIRIGVGRGDGRDLSNHVLGRVPPGDQHDLEAALRRAADAAEMFVSEGIERVMNVFNAATDSQQDPGPAA